MKHESAVLLCIKLFYYLVICIFSSENNVANKKRKRRREKQENERKNFSKMAIIKPPHRESHERPCFRCGRCSSWYLIAVFRSIALCIFVCVCVWERVTHHMAVFFSISIEIFLYTRSSHVNVPLATNVHSFSALTFVCDFDTKKCVCSL